jgi:hypothetical protein
MTELRSGAEPDLREIGWQRAMTRERNRPFPFARLHEQGGLNLILVTVRTVASMAQQCFK